MTEEKKTVDSGSMVLLALVHASVPFYRSFVLTYLWAWHVVPHFNVPALNLWSVFALLITAEVATFSFPTADWRAQALTTVERYDLGTDRISRKLTLITFGWIVGWVIHVAT